MGKTTGFIEFSRALPLLGGPAERVLGWDEFHYPLRPNELSDQAARCMNCGVPFCHEGETRNRIAVGCPIHNVIPEWNDHVYRDRWSDAFRILALTNNFPEFTGRVCPAPCESSCVLGINDDPVMIKEIELAIIERAFHDGLVKPRAVRNRTGRKAAIIGSGPAGLACADDLNQAGHNVTVFEREDRVGGLLTYGIPNMKLDKRIVERRVAILVEEGIDFRTNSAVGESISVDEIQASFDAIVLCCGAGQPRDLPIPGRELSGIHLAMDYLTLNTKHILDNSRGHLDLKGQSVIVIGGGDTGTDCVATAIRQQSRSVVQFEIQTKPPLRVADHDAWLANVRTFQSDYGHDEAVHKYGEDPRHFGIMTKRFIGDSSGTVTGLETVEVEWNGAELREIKGSEKVWEADAVLLAMGFSGPERLPLFEALGVEFDQNGMIAVSNSKQTTVSGVFAAGDCERGQSLVVWAIADGRRAAKGVDEYLLSLQ